MQTVDLVEAVIDTALKQGGRFLKYDKRRRIWYEIGPDENRDKVAHVIQDFSRASAGKKFKRSNFSRMNYNNTSC